MALPLMTVDYRDNRGHADDVLPDLHPWEVDDISNTPQRTYSFEVRRNPGSPPSELHSLSGDKYSTKPSVVYHEGIAYNHLSERRFLADPCKYYKNIYPWQPEPPRIFIPCTGHHSRLGKPPGAPGSKMTAEFPSFFNSQHRAPPTELSTFDQDLNVQDYVKIDFSHWRYPYVVNGVPISDTVRGCCAPDPCCCRSDVIFYDGKAYDQKPYIAGRLRTRPGDVMYLEGKLVPPFNPGKSVSVYGSIKSKNKRPLNMCSSHKQAGRRLSRSCNSTISKNCATPYYVNGLAYAYSRLGLPYGETIGYFRFKPDKVCDCRDVSVQYLEDCCTCEPGESNAALYVQDDCPARECCC